MGNETSNQHDSEGSDSETETETESNPCRHITILSTKYDLHSFMKDLACEIRKGSIPSLNGRLVVVLDFSVFTTKAEQLPAKVLLGSLFSDWDDPKLITGFEWMIKHPKKLVFLIYSLDTFPYELRWKRPVIRYYKPASADVIIHNLLAKNFFPDSLIISSTGQAKLEKLHPTIVPDHYIAIDRISDSSYISPIKELIGKSALEKNSNLHRNVWPVGDRAATAMKAFGMPTSLNVSAHDYEAKKKILSDHLIKQLNEETNERKRLELYLNLYEGREGSIEIVRTAIRDIELSEVPLNKFDVNAVSFLIALAKHLEAVNMRRCSLDAALMEIMAKNIIASHVKIDRFDISCNDVGTKGIMYLAKIIKHCRVKSLHIFDCGIRLPHLQKLQACTTGSKVPELDISSNDFGVDGMVCLGRLVKQWDVKHLDLGNCSLASPHLKKFLDGSGGIMLEVLNLTDWEKKPVYSPYLLDFLTRVRKDISLHGWQINEQQQKSIQEKLNKTNSKVLRVALNGGVELKALRAK